MPVELIFQQASNMPHGKRKPTKLTAHPFYLILLLVQITLIKIGQLPLFLIKLLLKISKFSLSALKKLQLPTRPKLKSKVSILTWQKRLLKMIKTLSKVTRSYQPKFPKFKIQLPPLNFKILRPKRGRPTKLPALFHQLRKLRVFIRKKIPKKAKIVLALGLAVAALMVYTRFILITAYQLPSPNKLTSSGEPLTTTIYDRNGVLLYRLYEGRNRSLVSLDDLPKYLIDATIATEDKNFYKHGGIDLGAMTRAFVHNLKNHHQEGASTITQQLIKNTLLTPEKTYTRKIKEVILSLWAESIYSKKQILQMYFNETPYGGPSWGIKAASQTYFDKEPKELTLAESAFLAGLPASPTQFSPYGTNPELGFERQKQVLQRMVEQEYITPAQMKAALSEKLNFKPPQDNIRAPHFVFYVKDLLSQIYGPRVISQGGLKIQTTLDFELQKQVEKIVSEEVDNLSALNVKNGAAMVTDPKTGQILAMVGSKNYYNLNFGNFNATLALRQPGSSIKVITYAEAFKQGFSPGNTILDAPTTFRDNWGNSYSPVNYDGTYHGPVSIRVALGSSLNIPAVKMLATIGVNNVIQTAADLGITTLDDPQRYGLSLTLGGGEVKMVEMMGVYGALSQAGKLNKPTGILKVTDASGNVLEEYQKEEKTALSAQVAYLISSILSDNNARTLAFGPNSLLNLPGVAVKTGTSDNKRDNWTFGYSPDFAVGVWVGNNDNSPMDPKLTSGITGAAPIWNKITKLMLAAHPSIGFTQPEGIIQANVNGRNDLVISNTVSKNLVSVKNGDNKTIFSDAFSSYATSSAQAAAKDSSTN